MRLFEHICFLMLLLFAVPAWSQSETTSMPSEPGALGSGSSDDPMKTPPPVSGQSYPTQITSEERSNYLRGGLAFNF